LGQFQGSCALSLGELVPDIATHCPSPVVKYAVRAMAGLVIIALLVSLAIEFSNGIPTLARFIEILFIVVFTAAICAWVIAEAKPIESLQLSDGGASGLVWKRFLRFLPYGAERLTIRWEDVKRIGFQGYVVILDDGGHQLSINTAVFGDSKGTLKFIKERLNAAVARDALHK
jgi:hypothetical protein